MPWWQRTSWRLSGALTLIWLALYQRLLFGSKVLPWDAADEFYPTVFFNATSLRHGLAPWWNPHIYSGFPQIGDPQGMLFSPLLMGWMMLPPSPGMTWFAWGVLLHVLMGGLAVLALLRSMQANALGALIGATVFMAGGVAASRIEHVSIVIAYAWAPVAWLALRRFIVQPQWSRAALLGAAAGVMLVHLVQFSYLMALVLTGYGAMLSAHAWRGYTFRQRVTWSLGVVLACALALAICVPQVMFSLAFAFFSTRAELPLSEAGPASLQLRGLGSLLLPNIHHALRGGYSGPASLVESYFYVGVLPLLMLAGLPQAWRQAEPRRQLIFVAAVAVLAVLYGLGVNTPFYGWLYSWLPGVKQFRRPSDAAYLINIALAFACGLAASQLRLDTPRQRTWMLGAAALWLALASAGMRAEGVRWLAWTAAAAVACIIALFVLRKRDAPFKHVAVALLALIVVDYRCFNLNGHFNEGGNSARYFLRNDVAAYLQEQTAHSSELLPPRIESTLKMGVWDNGVVLRDLYSTQGYNPMRYALYDHWYGARNSAQDIWPSRPWNAAPGGTVSALLGARYLLRHKPGPGIETMAVPAGYEHVFGDAVEVWRRENTLPRLLTPTRALTSDALPTPLQLADTDFREAFWLTPRDAQDRAEAQRDALVCRQSLKAVSAQYTNTSLTIRTQGDAGWLVLSELDFPGWLADVDGQPLAIHRANGMFRAVCVPGGEHTVSFRFHPWQMVAQAWRQHRAKPL